MLKQKDLKQLNKKGISKEVFLQQINAFDHEFPYIDLVAPVTSDAGIIILNDEQIDYYVKKYDQELEKLSVTKFVPASGAATRMFKNVYEWREKLENNITPQELKKENESAKMFFDRIQDFAFWDSLSNVMSLNGHNAQECLEKSDYLPILEFLLDDKGLNYGLLPKGLVEFHNYNGTSRTAFEEHLVEGALYGKDKNGNVNIHFTVSPKHIELFHNLLANVVDYYESLYNVKYNITFSVQDPSTDTIAVNAKNQPLRTDDGELFFRPGGHGALIYNLNTVNKDVIFIKNIDNVVPDKLKDSTVLYKKMLGGVLLELREEVFKLQEIIEKGELNDEIHEKAIDFACKKLNFDPATFNVEQSKQKEILSEMLNAPIRVCGMVKNENEPGGGPFWVYDESGKKSLQIIESSQINMDDPKQKKVFNNSTHFNPVDIVCSIKNHKGEKYGLEKYIDPNTGFVNYKSKDGNSIKALELPGLWNGAMTKWITVFVEVPIITFNPVKSVNDLLRDEHQ